MSSTSLQAYEVMDMVAPLMNDNAKTKYTYAAQIPYLNMALRELQEQYQLANVPVTNQTTSNPITIDIGTTSISPIDGLGKEPAPNYPNDLVEIRGVYERLAGSTDSFIPVGKRDFLPHAVDDIQVESLTYWIWESQRIKFIPATTVREVKLDYIRTLFPKITASEQQLGVINALSYLGYKTASLCALYIGENKSRSDELKIDAELAIGRAIGIATKPRQGINVRRRPFMASYKRRSFS